MLKLFSDIEIETIYRQGRCDLIEELKAFEGPWFSCPDCECMVTPNSIEDLSWAPPTLGFICACSCGANWARILEK